MSGGIGILDSGVGGLTVVKEVFRQLPLEEVIYIGDSARCPYGSRPTHEIYEYSMQMINFLMKFNPKSIVIACNTATSVILEDLKEKVSIPIISVIEPGARAAIRETKNNQIGVIGTFATIQSGAYERALRKTHPDLEITSLACPNLVPLVEQNHLNGDRSLLTVKKELTPLIQEQLDTLILGCTHYPIIADLIQQAVGENVALISSAEETANELSSVLSREQQLITTYRNPVHHFYTTGDEASFRTIAENWLNRSIEVTKVTLE